MSPAEVKNSFHDCNGRIFSWVFPVRHAPPRAGGLQITARCCRFNRVVARPRSSLCGQNRRHHATSPTFDADKLRASSQQLRDAAAIYAGKVAVRAADLASQGVDWAAPRAQAALNSAIEHATPRSRKPPLVRRLPPRRPARRSRTLASTSWTTTCRASSPSTRRVPRCRLAVRCRSALVALPRLRLSPSRPHAQAPQVPRAARLRPDGPGGAAGAGRSCGGSVRSRSRIRGPRSTGRIWTRIRSCRTPRLRRPPSRRASEGFNLREAAARCAAAPAHSLHHRRQCARKRVPPSDPPSVTRHFASLAGCHKDEIISLPSAGRACACFAWRFSWAT